MSDLDVLLTEERLFPPPDSFRRNAIVSSEELYDFASRDPESFWAKMAEELEWAKPWDRVLEWKPPRAKWYLGGKLNAATVSLAPAAPDEQLSIPTLV